MKHSDLINLGIKLGYKINELGLCFGFSAMWAQAVCNGALKTFYQRMSLLEKYKDSPEILLKEIEAVRRLVKGKKIVTDAEMAILEIPAFFEGITLFLSPHHYKEFFIAPLSQKNVSNISEYTQPQSAKSALHNIYNNTDEYNYRNELTNFLKDIARTLKPNADIALIFSASRHAVSARVIGNDQFEFIDTNAKDTSGVFSKNDIKPQTLTSQELADTLWFDTFANNGTLLLTTTLIASDDSKVLLKPSSSITTLKSNFYGQTILHIASLNNDLATLQRIDFTQINFNLVCVFGMTALQYACIYNSIDTINFLLNQPNVNVNTISPLSFSPFRSLLENKNFDTAKKLMQHPTFDFLSPDCFGTYLQNLAICAESKDESALEIAEILIKKGCDVHTRTKDYEENTVFHLACSVGNTKLAKLLVEKGAKPFDLSRRRKYSALHLTTDPETIKYLLEIKLDPNLQDVLGYTPLHCVSSHAPAESIRLLIDRNPKNCNVRTPDGLIPLICACEGFNIPAIQLLLPHTELSMAELETDCLFTAMSECDAETQQSFIIKGLTAYISERKKEGSSIFYDFLSYIGIGYTLEEKIQAAADLLNTIVNSEPNQYINNEVLNDGRLSKLYSFNCNRKKETPFEGQKNFSSYAKSMIIINDRPIRPPMLSPPIQPNISHNPMSNTLDNVQEPSVESGLPMTSVLKP